MKVLIAEDSNVARHMLKAALTNWGYEVVSTCDGQQAWNAIQTDDSLRLVILDWMMPGMDGVDLCHRIREQKTEHYIYVILLTVKDGRDCLVEGMQAGADDFLTKPFDAEELEQRLRAGRRIVELQDQLLATQETLRVRAMHDTLTGILNRGAIIERLTQELDRGRRCESRVSVVMVDLDHFKRINDTYGHQRGDEILLLAAESLCDSVRIYDSVGRYGGEEFLVVLPGVDTEQAAVIAERMRSGLTKNSVKIADDEVTVTASLGVATTDEACDVAGDALIFAADAAMYRAKSEGRNRVCQDGVGCTSPTVAVTMPPIQGHRERILVVSDDNQTRELITRWLTAIGYTCAQVENGDAAMEYLRENEVHAVTMDLSIPRKDVMNLLADFKMSYPNTEVVMITDLSDTKAAIEALTRGACGYLIKPIDREQVVFQVVKALERRQLMLEKGQYTHQLETRVRQQTLQVRQAHEETILRLSSASMFRDEETGEHLRRVGLSSELMANTLSWSPIEVEKIRMAAPMHDVGNIGIPDAILKKPGKLTDKEFEVMKTHTTIGAQMLDGSESQMLQMAQEIALAHHERWDAAGYPHGLAGPDIPESARIVAIVDVYDALRHDRVYRPAMPEEQVLKIISKGCGRHFDPDLLSDFFSVLPEMRRIAEENPDTQNHTTTTVPLFNLPLTDNPRVEPASIVQ